MTSQNEFDEENKGTAPKTAPEVIDIKTKPESGTTRLVTANGNMQEVADAGDFMAKLNTGNIVIDPVLTEKANKSEAPPLTIAEALERGDFVALARMMQAQIARAENGDLEGMRYEDAQRYASRQNEKEAMEERVREREQQLTAFFDTRGGYRDREGGYFNAKENTYTDSEGGVVDNYQGYRYKDGSYKSKTGDYYDATTRTMHLANGDTYKIPPDSSDADVIKIMQDNAREQGYYDPNFIKNGQLGTADAEHPPSGPKGEGWSATQVQDVAANARAHRGPDLRTGAPASGNKATVTTAAGTAPVTTPTARDIAVASQTNTGPDVTSSAAPLAHPLTASSLKEKLAKAKAAKAAASTSADSPDPASDLAPGTNKESKFSNGAAAVETSRGNGTDVTTSSFFAVDSSISSSKFPVQQPEAAVSDTDPIVTANANTAKRPAVKSPAP